MTDRSHKTRQKMTFRVAPPKPRNPLIVPAIRRVAGAHRKSTGAVRSSERQALKRVVGAPEDDD